MRMRKHPFKKIECIFDVIRAGLSLGDSQKPYRKGQFFIPLVAMPPIICFCRNANTTSKGMMDNTVAARMEFQSVFIFPI